MAGNDEIFILDADNINYKSICCEKIPDLFLDKLVAKNHFNRFGKITRFILRPSRQSCTVEYETEDQAERALMEAGDYNGHKFKIDYAEREVAHVQNTEEWVDSDVQAELEAMNPGQRLTSGPIMHRQAQPPPPVSAMSKMSARITKPAAQMLPPKVAKALPPIELPKVDVALRQELEAVLRRPAYTDEDKYRVLDARDKLIRLTTVRQTDIKKAVSTKGTCPDMCPEKERLMREFQRQVSSFETSSGYESDASNISHRRAIKEYSRSSADQEVPLSHELRPEGVLKMTMLYLMHRIMDLCDDAQTSLADWFHFVWDRTRSIRKDITQQELCSLGAVQLVEQCARFHIHCAARMVAEDSAVFDKKINAENLTKCLQSLKYMYHDLRIKRVHCPCEAEFRSYIVLLNLGDANFLWELKQLPTHIQNSNEIRRAIAFYNALQNNNYVRFFSMIRSPETTYLSACILLGYFNKLRWRAMEAINKSHNWRKNAVFLPLAYLTKVLGFEDANAAAHYFRYHELQCDKERVLLDRLKMPDTEYSMERALKLVESKRMVTVGECVYGQPLDPADIFEKHEPHCSFDTNGVLRPEAWGAEDQLRGDIAAAKALERKQQQSRMPPSSVKTQIPLPPPPTVRTDANIFKVPQALAPISPKQQQLKSTTPSVFGGDQHSEKKATSASPVAANFKFKADVNSPNTPASTSSQSIFKIPTISPKQASSAASIFNSSSEQPPPTGAGGNIFGSAINSGQSIFGAAARETKSIFGEQRTQQLQPQPLQTDNIFQHFQTPVTKTAFGDSCVPSIFGNTTATSLSHQNDEPLAKQPFKQPADSQLAFGMKTNQGENRDLREQHETAETERRRQRQKDEEEEEALEQQKQEALAMLHEQQQQREAKQQRQREQAAERLQSLEALAFKAEATTKRELEAMVGEEIFSIAYAELCAYQRFEQHSQLLLEAIIQKCVCEQVNELAAEEYAVMCHDQMLLCRYFERWLQHTRRKLQQRALMESTPIWVTTDTRAEQTAQLLHPRQHENLRMIKRYRHGEPCDFKVLLWQAPRSPVPPAVDICRIIARHSKQRQVVKAGRLQLRKYFKLLLTLPTDEEELPGFASLCDKWLQKHVRQPPYPSATTPEQRTNAAFICAAEHQVALCVRKLSGMVPLNEQCVRVRNECDHADAIVCCLSSVNLQHTRKRLHHLLKLSNIHKSVPVGLVVYNGDQDELQLADVLELNELIDEGKVAAYKFFGCLDPKSQFSFSHQLSRALRFVARESSSCSAEADALEMQSLHSWLEVSLGEEMWQRWHESAQRNPAFAKICCTPRYVIGIYNEALERLQEIAAEDMEEAPEFPNELREFVPKIQPDIPLTLEYFPPDWKNPRRKQQIVELLSRLKLPAVSEQCPTDLEQMELWLLNYAGCCIPHNDDAATQAGFEAIKTLIAQLNAAELQPWELPERLGMVSFLPVIKTLTFAHTNSVLKEYRQSTKKQQQLPTEIIYRRQALLDYQVLPWWLNSKSVEAVTVDYTQTDDALTATSEQQQAFEAVQSSEQELKEIIARAERVSRKAERNLCALRRQNVDATSCELSHELDSSLYQFELAKQIGTFDVSFVEQLTDEIDAELDGAVGGSGRRNECGGGDGDANKRLPVSRKRKHTDSERREIDVVMSRALGVIEKVESLQDNNERLQRTAMLELEFL